MKSTRFGNDLESAPPSLDGMVVAQLWAWEKLRRSLTGKAGKGGMTMAWGILVAGFSLFGMLMLAVASVRMDEGSIPTESTQAPEEPVAEAADLKKAA